MRLLIILLSCYFVVFVFGQLSRVSLPEINIHLADVVVGFLMISWLIWKIIKKDKFVLPPLTNNILLFFLIALISLALNSSVLAQSVRKGNLLEGREMVVAWLYLFRWIFYAGFYFLIFDLCYKYSDFRKQVKMGLVITGLMTAILGLGQYIFLPDTRFLEPLGWDPHYYRLIGTFLDPGFTGIILTLCIFLATLQILSRKNVFRWLVAWCVVYVALALTYSRASYLAYVIGIGIISYFKRLPYLFLFLLILGIITVWVLPRPGGEGVKLSRESTVKFRIINWGQSLMVAKDHLWWGVGFNAYRYTQRDYGYLDFANWRASHAGGGADSSILFVLATTGIFGFLAYLWLWWRILTSSYRLLNLAILASMVALLVHSEFVNSLFYPWVMGWYWILLGSMEVKAES